MYLKRKIDRVLTDWNDEEKRLPLIIRGPRQVGKTTAVRHFAASHYESVIEVKSPSTISGPPTLVKQDVKVSSPKALRERECALAVAVGRTKVSHSSFAVSEK